MTTMTAEQGQQFGQGISVELASIPEGLRKRAFDEAFDYRGDVTLTLTDGSVVECYIFDRRAGQPPIEDRTTAAPATTPGGRRMTVVWA